MTSGFQGWAQVRLGAEGLQGLMFLQFSIRGDVMWLLRGHSTGGACKQYTRLLQNRKAPDIFNPKGL